jgi:hypothetical protein
MVPSARAEFLGRRTATGRVSAAGCERDVAPRQNQLSGAAETKFVVCESPIHAGFFVRAVTAILELRTIDQRQLWRFGVLGG